MLLSELQESVLGQSQRFQDISKRKAAADQFAQQRVKDEEQKLHASDSKEEMMSDLRKDGLGFISDVTTDHDLRDTSQFNYDTLNPETTGFMAFKMPPAYGKFYTRMHEYVKGANEIDYKDGWLTAWYD